VDLCNVELRQIEMERLSAIDFARYQTLPSEAMARANEVANTRASAARQSLHAQVVQFRSESEAAKNEMSLLAERQRRLLATVPKE
jgi:hypothetical protein